jgi:hypothetical protein
VKNICCKPYVSSVSNVSRYVAVFHMDVAKVDLDVAYVAIVVHYVASFCY